MPPQKPENEVPLRRVDSESSIITVVDDDADSHSYHVRKSSLMRMINWAHVFTTYIPMLFVLGIGVFVALIVQQVVLEFMESKHFDTLLSFESIVGILGAIRDLVARQIESLHNLRKEAIFAPSVEICFVILVVMAWILRMDNPVYLLSYATFKAPDSWRITHDDFLKLMRNQGCFDDENMGFMERLLAKSSIGQSTAFPPGITKCLDGGKADRSIEASRKEAETIIFDIVERAMKKANVKPKDIDVLVINCSLFSPTPSLCAMVISHFQMRSDILSYNLSGMGCGASLLALDLGAKMLQRNNKSGKALIISTEIITPNLYHGNERAFLLQNTLFRCGGAAMVLSNSWFDGHRALFKLLHLVRTQGTNETAYECVFETQDSAGHRGVRLSKDIVKVAGKCMEKNLTTMGPYVLPISEQLKVVATLVARYVLKMYGNIFNTKKYPNVKIYVPDFKRGIDHFCIHAGGRAVIDGIEKNMKLKPYHTEPSRMTLMNYGNTSSSSIWYELEYIMEHQKTNPLKKGDRIMQIGFGSGFKCCSGVWLKL